MRLVAKITLQRFDEHAEYRRVITIEEDADSQWRYSVNVHKGRHSLPSVPADIATSETKKGRSIQIH
jgi:hypothetical protein